MPDFRVIPNPVIDYQALYNEGLGGQERTTFAAGVKGLKEGLAFGADLTAKILETRRLNDPDKLAAEQLRLDLQNKQIEEVTRGASIANDLREEFGARDEEARIYGNEQINEGRRIENELDSVYGSRDRDSTIASREALTDKVRLDTQLSRKYGDRETDAKLREQEADIRYKEAQAAGAPIEQITKLREALAKGKKETGTRTISPPSARGGGGANLIPNISQPPPLTPAEQRRQQLDAQIEDLLTKKIEEQLSGESSKVTAQALTSNLTTNAQNESRRRLELAGEAVEGGAGALADVTGSGEQNLPAFQKHVGQLSEIHRTETDEQLKKVHASALSQMLRPVGAKGIEDYIDLLPEEERNATTKMFAAAAIRSGDSSLFSTDQKNMLQAGATVVHAADPQKTFDDIAALLNEGGPLVVKDDTIKELMFSSDAFRAMRQAAKNGTQGIIDLGPDRTEAKGGGIDTTADGAQSQANFQFTGEDKVPVYTIPYAQMSQQEKATVHLLSTVASQHNLKLQGQRQSAGTVRELQAGAQAQQSAGAAPVEPAAPVGAQAQPTVAPTPAQPVAEEGDQEIAPGIYLTSKGGIKQIYNKNLGVTVGVEPTGRDKAWDRYKDEAWQELAPGDLQVSDDAAGDRLELAINDKASRQADTKLAAYDKALVPMRKAVEKKNEEIDKLVPTVRAIERWVQRVEGTNNEEIQGQSAMLSNIFRSSANIMGLSTPEDSEKIELINERERISLQGMLDRMAGLSRSLDTPGEQRLFRTVLLDESTEFANIRNYITVNKTDILRDQNSVELFRLMEAEYGGVDPATMENVVEQYRKSRASERYIFNSAKYEFVPGDLEKGRVRAGREAEPDFIDNTDYKDAHEFLKGTPSKFRDNMLLPEERKAAASAATVPPTSGGPPPQAPPPSGAGPTSAPPVAPGGSQQAQSPLAPEAAVPPTAQRSARAEPTPEIRGYIEKYAGQFGVPLDIAFAMADAESTFNPNAVSKKGAQGVMQLMPKTAASLGVKPGDTEDNVRGGMEYFGQMLKAAKGDPILALAMYNAGPGAVQKYGGVPPFEETQNYIKKIMGRVGEAVSDPVGSFQRGKKIVGDALSGVPDALNLTEAGKERSLKELTNTWKQNPKFNQKEVDVAKQLLIENGDDPGAIDGVLRAATPDLFETIGKYPINKLKDASVRFTELIYGPEAAEQRRHQLDVDEEAVRQLQQQVDVNNPIKNLIAQTAGFVALGGAATKVSGAALRTLALKSATAAGVLKAITGRTVAAPFTVLDDAASPVMSMGKPLVTAPLSRAAAGRGAIASGVGGIAEIASLATLDGAATFIEQGSFDPHDPVAAAGISAVIQFAIKTVGLANPIGKRLQALFGGRTAEEVAQEIADNGGTRASVIDLLRRADELEAPPTGLPGIENEVIADIANREAGRNAAGAVMPRIERRAAVMSSNNMADLDATPIAGGSTVGAARSVDRVQDAYSDAIGGQLTRAGDEALAGAQADVATGFRRVQGTIDRSATEHAADMIEDMGGLTGQDVPDPRSRPAPTTYDETIDSIRGSGDAVRDTTRGSYAAVARQFRDLDPEITEDLTQSLRNVSATRGQELIDSAARALPDEFHYLEEATEEAAARHAVAPNLRFLMELDQQAGDLPDSLRNELQPLIRHAIEEATSAEGAQPGIYDRLRGLYAEAKLMRSEAGDFTAGRTNISVMTQIKLKARDLERIQAALDLDPPAKTYPIMFGPERRTLREAGYSAADAQEIRETLRTIDRGTGAMGLLNAADTPKKVAALAPHITGISENLIASAQYLSHKPSFIEAVLNMDDPNIVTRIRGGLGPQNEHLIEEGAVSWLKRRIAETATNSKLAVKQTPRDILNLNAAQWENVQSMMPSPVRDAFTRFMDRQIAIERSVSLFKPSGTIARDAAFEGGTGNSRIRRPITWVANTVGTLLQHKISATQAKNIIQEITNDPVRFYTQVADHLETVADTAGNEITKVISNPVLSPIQKDVLRTIIVGGMYSQNDQRKTKREVTSRQRIAREEAAEGRFTGNKSSIIDEDNFFR